MTNRYKNLHTEGKNQKMLSIELLSRASTSYTYSSTGGGDEYAS
jgi:hypothetical protein